VTLEAPRRRLSLAMIFPLLEVATLASAWRLGGDHPWIAAGLLGLAPLLLCLSVHVSLHEAVHQPALARFPLAGPILTLVMGLPFQGYRWHHLTHHRWNNALPDYSTTWRPGPDGPRPWPLWRYVLGWPRQLVRSGLAMRAAYRQGGIPASVHRATRREQATLLAALAAGALVHPRAAGAYVAVVYVGWALIALQNYGQHPPRVYGHELPTSYYAALYNRLLFRNGLHAEHHARPHLPWYDLQAAPHPPIRAPHLRHPLLGNER
jgi:fatty acid desaturase